ncbi:MAG: DUF3592 domain-containing protein [Desulfobacteraceae bacterium]|nr:MAG: DUF3592 domain-containing protein [Desulfobacteraceae bacterium]
MTRKPENMRPYEFSGTGNRLTFGEVRRAFFRTKEGFFVIFGLFFGGIPLIIGGVFLSIVLHEAKLLREGMPAQATIVGKHVSSSDKSTTYRIYYEFTAADGKKYGDDYSTDRKEYYTAEEGGHLEVRYAKDAPFDSAVAGRGSDFSWWVFLFLSVFVAIGGTFLFFGIRGLHRRLRLYGKGLTAWGKNLGIQTDYSMKVNGRPCRVLEFEYTDWTGQKHVCRSAYLSDKTIKHLESMQSVPVVYLPDRPEAADLDLEALGR